MEFNFNSCAFRRVYECHLTIADYVSYVLGIEDKRRNMEKELGNFLKDLPISLFLNPSLMRYEDFECQMKAYLELIKVNPLAFEKSILSKEVFERICKYFIVEHLYYHIPFEDCFSKLFIILRASFEKNSCAFISWAIH
ncbi:hypothetical protein M9H77_35972 [Catharanthus roseus]|uniref:Uncharacterized protein n=1 Tax=Catharanthus roseus TaxID=4058 RepID=A0ACB9ZUR3_CATRO|nr:hypothetical protein M9H77_35972 [Catharanthus roseus]